jgi:beta-apo-4'-carotenal oxygenase
VTDPADSIKDHEQQIVEALRSDLGKPQFETEVSESVWLENDIVFISKNLHKWVKDEKADDIDLTFKFMNPKIRKDPLGTVLVIGCGILRRFAVLV